MKGIKENNGKTKKKKKKHMLSPTFPVGGDAAHGGDVPGRPASPTRAPSASRPHGFLGALDSDARPLFAPIILISRPHPLRSKPSPRANWQSSRTPSPTAGSASAVPLAPRALPAPLAGADPGGPLQGQLALVAVQVPELHRLVVGAADAPPPRPPGLGSPSGRGLG